MFSDKPEGIANCSPMATADWAVDADWTMK
jgi:hypothetical protein